MNRIGLDHLRRFGSYITVVLAAPFLSSCQSSSNAVLNNDLNTSVAERTAPKPEMILEEAESLLKQGKLQKAHQSFVKILTTQPGSNRAKIGLAETLRLSGNSQQALEVAKEVFADPVYGSQAKTSSGLIELSLGNLDRAAELLDASLLQRQDQWRAWNGLGILYDRRGIWDQAEDCYKTALTYTPNSPIVLNNLGMSVLMRGRFEEGRSLFESALKQDPTNNQLRNNWRLAVALLGKYREASAGLDAKNSPNALNNIGYIAMLRGDYVQAESYFVQAIEASPTYFPIAQENLRVLSGLKTIKE